MGWAVPLKLGEYGGEFFFPFSVGGRPLAVSSVSPVPRSQALCGKAHTRNTEMTKYEKNFTAPASVAQ